MIELQGIGKTFGTGASRTLAVADVNLKIKPRSIVALIGPSGCGKSTLLNMVAGLYRPSSGQVIYDGRSISDVNTDVGYMTQKDNLLPWRNVLDNIALPLELTGVARETRSCAWFRHHCEARATARFQHRSPCRAATYRYQVRLARSLRRAPVRSHA